MKKLFDNIKNYIQDLKSGEKKLSKDGMLILFFSGLLLYVVLLPINNNSSYKNKTTEENTTTGRNAVQTEDLQETNYQKKLEKELAAFLSEVEGIGKVEVLIYLDCSEQYIVEKDIPSYQVTSQEADTQSREENKEEDTVYTVNEAGEQVPFITQTKHPSIEGVVIAAEGAGNEKIRIQIVRTVMALYGVDANKIDVLERKKS